MPMATPAKHTTAFTLLEALVACSLLAVAIIGITVPFVAAVRSEQVDANNTSASRLAQELMEEILSKKFTDATSSPKNGPEPGETDRFTYDSINDYDAYYEAPGQIRNYLGQAISDPSTTGLSRKVSVTYVYVSGQDTSKSASFARVVVEIRYYDQLVLKLTRLVYNTTQS